MIKLNEDCKRFTSDFSVAENPAELFFTDGAVKPIKYGLWYFNEIDILGVRSNLVMGIPLSFGEKLELELIVSFLKDLQKINKGFVNKNNIPFLDTFIENMGLNYFYDQDNVLRENTEHKPDFYH